MKQYLAVLIIILWSANLALANAPRPEDAAWWDTAVTGTLYKGDTLSNGPYTVKAVNFPAGVPGIKKIDGTIVPEDPVDPQVFLEVYNNGTLIKELILTLASGVYTDPDNEVKVSFTGGPAKNSQEWVLEYYKPYAAISIQRRALPKIDVTVTTDKSTYTSYDDQIITATAQVTNSGHGYAKNIDVYLNIDDLKLRGGDTNQLHKYYYELNSGESQSFSVILVVPELIDMNTYNLSADAKGFDIKYLEYKAATSKLAITVSPKLNYFVISKGMRDRMYLKNIATVRVNVGNGGMFDIYNIRVNDSLNDNFALMSNTSLQWVIPVLKPGQEWGTTYSLKPLEANLDGFIIPAVNANFTVNNKPYSASSQTITVVVNGPKILFNKTVDKSMVNLSDNVNVTVSLRNVGDIGTKIEVKDSLPDSVSMVGGPTSLLNWSDPDSVMNFTYTIRMNQEGNIELPAAVINYTEVEYRGLLRAKNMSNRPIVSVMNPNKSTPTPTETPKPAETVALAGPQQTTVPEETLTQKIIHSLESLIPGAKSKNSSQGTPEPTPTPITPGFNGIIAVLVLVFAASRRRR
ncbi:MAG: hypothetical protein O8C66_11030 [Candidatus Methanoperedens sp.]|nr:hypothetical protein [Candidatus Methanoperedens sp.]MCZ7371032.1 hypothetical protein [Candidatus Methanoperedens sp.]